MAFVDSNAPFPPGAGVAAGPGPSLVQQSAAAAAAFGASVGNSADAPGVSGAPPDVHPLINHVPVSIAPWGLCGQPIVRYYLPNVGNNDQPIMSSQKYTLYSAEPKVAIPRHVLQVRVSQGKKLRAMYRSLGWSRADCGKFLHTSERTLRNWETGRSRIPFAAFKLLRIHCHLELPGAAWRGWSLARGKLCTPEGHLLDPKDACWWSLLVRRAEVGARAIVKLDRLRRQKGKLQSSSQLDDPSSFL